MPSCTGRTSRTPCSGRTGVDITLHVRYNGKEPDFSIASGIDRGVPGRMIREGKKKERLAAPKDQLSARDLNKRRLSEPPVVRQAPWRFFAMPMPIDTPSEPEPNTLVLEDQSLQYGFI